VLLPLLLQQVVVVVAAAAAAAAFVVVAVRDIGVFVLPSAAVAVESLDP